jgi:hypothetical protein
MQQHDPPKHKHSLLLALGREQTFKQCFSPLFFLSFFINNNNNSKKLGSCANKDKQLLLPSIIFQKIGMNGSMIFQIQIGVTNLFQLKKKGMLE